MLRGFAHLRSTHLCAPGLRLVAWLLPLLWLLCAAPAVARENHIVERGLLRDTSGSLGIAEASQGEYRAMPEVLAVGFTTDTCWVRLKIVPPAGVGELVLRIRPAYLDDVRLYAPDPTAPGGWRISQAGDRFSQALRERPGAAMSLPLHGLAQPTTVYLRVRSSNNLQFHAQALAEREADEADNLQTASFGIYLGVMLALLGWALVDYLADRDRVLGWFIPYQVAGIFYGAAVTGYLGWLLPVRWSSQADLLTSALVIAMPFFGLLCNRALLREHQPARWGLQALAWLLLLPPLEMLALLLGQAQPALIANTVLVLLAAPLLFAVSLTTRADGAPRRWVLRLVYGLLALQLVLFVLPVLGLADAVAWRLHISLSQALVTGLLIFAMLHARSRDLLRSRQQALLELQVARERAGHDRLEKEEKARFMTMLTHELHSPLLVMRMAMAQVEADASHHMDALGRANVHESLRDMEKLIDRCLQADRIEQSHLAVVREPFLLAPVLADLVSATGQAGRIQCAPVPALELRSDETLFRVLVANLLDNAMKYSPDGSAVQLQAAQTERAGRPLLRLSVANLPGRAGLPDAERVFQKYYRARGARDRRGTGLGLWLVRGISQHLGGDARLLPDGERVVFEIELPLV